MKIKIENPQNPGGSYVTRPKTIEVDAEKIAGGAIVKIDGQHNLCAHYVYSEEDVFFKPCSFCRPAPTPELLKKTCPELCKEE